MIKKLAKGVWNDQILPMNVDIETLTITLDSGVKKTPANPMAQEYC